MNDCCFNFVSLVRAGNAGSSPLRQCSRVAPARIAVLSQVTTPRVHKSGQQRDRVTSRIRIGKYFENNLGNEMGDEKFCVVDNLKVIREGSEIVVRLIHSADAGVWIAAA